MSKSYMLFFFFKYTITIICSAQVVQGDQLCVLCHSLRLPTCTEVTTVLLRLNHFST